MGGIATAEAFIAPQRLPDSPKIPASVALGGHWHHTALSNQAIRFGRL
jgi:hypothetical protein